MNRLGLPPSLALVLLLVLLLVLCWGCGLDPAGEPAPEAAAKAKPGATAAKIYDEQADAAELIAIAESQAQADGKRVLLVLGGNWCHWCRKLHELFQADDEIRGLLAQTYVVVWVDEARLSDHDELESEFRPEIRRHGVPLLVVLSPTGRRLIVQNTGDLEAGPIHDPEKVRLFLQRWAEEREAEAAQQ